MQEIRDQAWWLHLQPAIRKFLESRGNRPITSFTLHVPLQNTLNEAAVIDFARLRDIEVASSDEEES